MQDYQKVEKEFRKGLNTSAYSMTVRWEDKERSSATKITPVAVSECQPLIKHRKGDKPTDRRGEPLAPLSN